MNILQKFLILCSGSSYSILEKSPSEINKHIGIGGVIFFTGLLAAISAGYALFMVFGNVLWAVIFGLIWGLMIFNLDRFIVSSMRKTGGFFKQLFTASPRLILAALLGIVISKPLELKIFDKEINKQLNVIINRNKTELQDSVSFRYAGMKQVLLDERTVLLNRMERVKQEINQAQTELDKEIVGTATETTTGKAGYGPNAKRKQAFLVQKQAELDSLTSQLQPRLAALNSKVDSLSSDEKAELIAAAPVEDNYNGFAARMQALNELSTNNRIIGIASLFIMLIFITMEMAPVLVKLIAPKGPYDELLDAHEHSFQLYNKEKKAKGEISTDQRIKIHEIESEEKIVRAEKLRESFT